MEETFAISGRGVAVVFRGSSEGLPAGVPLRARVHRADGSTLDVAAFVEWLLRRQPVVDERAALLLRGATKAELPRGTRIEILEAEES